MVSGGRDPEKAVGENPEGALRSPRSGSTVGVWGTGAAGGNPKGAETPSLPAPRPRPFKCEASARGGVERRSGEPPSHYQGRSQRPAGSGEGGPAPTKSAGAGGGEGQRGRGSRGSKTPPRCAADYRRAQSVRRGRWGGVGVLRPLHRAVTGASKLSPGDAGAPSPPRRREPGRGPGREPTLLKDRPPLRGPKRTDRGSRAPRP